VKAQIVVPVGGGGICFILAWVSFAHYHDTRTGVIFVVIGLIVVVLGLVLGGRKG